MAQVKSFFGGVQGGPRGGGIVPPPPHPPYISADIDRTQDISTVSFQNNAWEESIPEALTFLLGASLGGGPSLPRSAITVHNHQRAGSELLGVYVCFARGRIYIYIYV